MTDSQDIEHTTARVIAMARDIAASSADGPTTAAAFDYDIACHGIGGPYSPIGSAIHVIANERLPAVTTETPEQVLDERAANAARLRETLQPALDRYAARCRDRKYTGWSNASSGPIRYAER